MKSQIEPVLTIADLDAMPDDGNLYELIDGRIFMSRAPSITHQRILRNLMKCFLTYLAQKPIGEVVPGPGMVISDYSAVIPDLGFVSNRRRSKIISEERIIGPPELVIEILSPGKENMRRDRNVKRRLYGEFGVKEYWLVDPENQYIEVYRHYQQGLNLHTTVGGDLEISTQILPGFSCKASSIFQQ